MRSARGIASLVLAVAMATGCTDTTNPAASVTEPAIAPPQTSAHYTAIGPQSAPEGASGEWTASTSITVEAAAGFRNDAVNPDEGVPGNVRAFAWGQSIVRYFANEADAAVTLLVTRNGSPFAQDRVQESARHWFPGHRSLFATTQLGVPAPCGYKAEAKAFGEVWNRAIIPPVGWMEWGRKTDNDVEPAYQPACESGPPPGAGGSVEKPDPVSGNCPWHRDYIVFADGSWKWLTSWYRSCADELIAAGGPTEVAQSMASIAGTKRASSGPMRITLVSARNSGNGPVVAIERNGEDNADAVIIVDLTRATAADLEEAFISAEGLSLKVKPKEARSAYGQIISGSSTASRAAAVDGSRAANNLAALIRAVAARGKSGGRAQVDVVVNRRP